MIDYFIRQNANQASIERGWTLYQEGAVFEIEILDGGKIVEAAVEGLNDIYSVAIYDYKNMNIAAECGCPYNYGGICKHCVAVLYALSALIDEKKIIAPKITPITVSRKSSTPVAIEGFESLTKTKLSKYLGYSGYYYSNCNIERIQITDKGLSFVVSNPTPPATNSLHGFIKKARVIIVIVAAIKRLNIPVSIRLQYSIC